MNMIEIKLKDSKNLEQIFLFPKSIVTVGGSPDCDVPLSLVQSDKPALYIRKSGDLLLLHPCVPGISNKSGSILSMNADEKVLPDAVYLLPWNYSLQASIKNQKLVLESNDIFVHVKREQEDKTKIGKAVVESGSTSGRVAAFAFLGFALLAIALGSIFASSDGNAESGEKISQKKEIYGMFVGKSDNFNLTLVKQAEMHAAVGSVDKAIGLYHDLLSSVENETPLGDKQSLLLLRTFAQSRISELLKIKRQPK
jgi:hypothetical protein